MTTPPTRERIADLPLTVRSFRLERLESHVSSDFRRLTTVIRLEGDDRRGIGEDVTYEVEDQEAFVADGVDLPTGRRIALGAFCEAIGELDLFPREPVSEISRNFRRWAFESAALDLALRQAGTSLAEILEIEPRPVRFVVSLSLGDPPALEPLRRRLQLDPDLRFKLDPTPEWSGGLIDALVATEAVDVLDFKGHYRNGDGYVGPEPDPGLYRRLAEAFPRAWLEDPWLDNETGPALEGHRDRITWDKPICSVADVEELPFPPRVLNSKPSRIGSLRRLLDFYDHCRDEGIGLYGGGQFELGPGRGQIQYLASLFHPDAPNDVAPAGYNDTLPAPGLPSSPLSPDVPDAGFRRTV